jgi:O-succinylbenzoic acid--CoA ligase
MDTTLLNSESFWSDTALTAPAGLPPGFQSLTNLKNHVLFETSGSSGTPKWVALTKTALLSSAAAVNQHLHVTLDSCWGLSLPVHHVGGFGVAARAYNARCRFTVFEGRWEPAFYAYWLEESQVTHTSLVPTQVHDLVKAGLHAPSCLTAIVVGGGHLSIAIGQAARALGWPVLASYGMTESASQIATQNLDQLKMIYQPSPISILPIWKTLTSEASQLQISGPALFSGYVIIDKTRPYFSPRTSEWHTTSDRVLLDMDQLTPLGRADSLVKVLGELVDPEAIERELVNLSAGQLALGKFAIIAILDKRNEHVLVPVFETSLAISKAESILALYQNTAPGFRRLASSISIGSFPRSPLGKLLRNDLSALCTKILLG